MKQIPTAAQRGGIVELFILRKSSQEQKNNTEEIRHIPFVGPSWLWL